MTVAVHRSWAKDLDTATLYELLKLRVEVFVVNRPALPGTRRPRPAAGNPPLLARRPAGRGDLHPAPDGGAPRRAEGVPARPAVHRAGSPRARSHHTAAPSRAGRCRDYPCRIDAQTYLEEMYARHGFVRAGDEFLDDGVPHVPMVRAGTLHGEAP